MGLGERIWELVSPRKVGGLRIQVNAIPDPITKKQTPFGTRVPKEFLEAVYMESPPIFNTVNKMTQIIMRTKYKFVGDKKSVDFFENFFAAIGTRGGEKSWRSLLKDIYRYQFIYGWNPVELVHDKNAERIVDLDGIDPKRFDYAKNGRNLIALDEYQNPLGYVQILDPIIQFIQRFDLPEDVHLYQGQLFIPPERVALFKMYTTGDGFYPLGIIEPIYNTYIRHKATEEGFAQAAWRLGNPIIWVKVGTDLRPPSEEKLKNAAETVKDINSKSTFATEYTNDLKILESKMTKDMRTPLDYFVDMEVAGMGMPKALATSGGEATNRATLKDQQYLMKLALNDIMESVVETIEMKVIRKIAEMETKLGNKINPIKMVYDEIALEEMDSKAVRLAKYGQTGLLQADENLDDYIREMEKLPERKGPYEKPQTGGFGGFGGNATKPESNKAKG